MRRSRWLWTGCCATLLAFSACEERPAGDDAPAVSVENSAYPEQVFWGDTHLHTDVSVDAFGFGNRLGAEDAVRFAMGEKVTSTTGIAAQLSRPLDFLVISDHAAAMGATRAIYNAPRIALLTDKFLLRWHDMMHESADGSLRVTAELIDGAAKGTLPDKLVDPERSRDRIEELWSDHAELMDRYNAPGTFTTFMGFEYTPMPGGDNLHRVVMFRDGAHRTTRVIPFSSSVSLDPEDLWAYMAAYEKDTGGQVIAIPHNSNVSNGRMFEMRRFDGSAIDAAYAETRARFEPVVEVTQIKGDSETHPFLSPNDEFASFGVAGWDTANLSATKPMTSKSYAGSYVREALKRGLELEAKFGTNPFKFGMIGATDSHTSLATADEDQFFGKHSAVEPGNTQRAIQAQNLGTRKGRFGWHYLASGYAGVWATSNSRGAIFDAMKRREVYATTGPRMTVRMFAGWDFEEADLDNALVAAGYARGVPMGGDLVGGEGREAPTFMIRAQMDAEGANLDRVQLVKGWIDAAGKTHEKIYNVSWSDPEQRKRAADGSLPPVGNSVDLATGAYQNVIGAAELQALWTDPQFDPDVASFYYVRVLQIPTPRWPLLDAIKHGLTLPDDAVKVHQERAYTSPIWYRPAG